MYFSSRCQFGQWWSEGWVSVAQLTTRSLHELNDTTLWLQKYEMQQFLKRMASGSKKNDILRNSLKMSFFGNDPSVSCHLLTHFVCACTWIGSTPYLAAGLPSWSQRGLVTWKCPSFPEIFRVQLPARITKNNSQGMFFVAISCQRACPVDEAKVVVFDHGDALTSGSSVPSAQPLTAGSFLCKVEVADITTVAGSSCRQAACSYLAAKGLQQKEFGKKVRNKKGT